MKKLQAFIFILAMLCCQLAFAAPKIKGTLLYVPLDNRPVCLAYPVETMEAAGWEVKTPPLEYIAGAEKGGDPDALFDWLLENADESLAMVISSDALVYGGLVDSRTHHIPLEVLKHRADRLVELKKDFRDQLVYVFTTIMRSPKRSAAPVEPAYYKEWGAKIFRLGELEDKLEAKEIGYREKRELRKLRQAIPQEILDDYLNTRKRNFEINKLYLEWQKEGLLDTLIFSKDDCAEFGFNVDEARELENLGGKTKTGADEIPLSLLARAVNKEIKIYVEYTENEYKNLISNYEDVPIEQSVLGQLELGGFQVVESKEEADVVLLVNNFVGKQGELVMAWDTEPYNKNLIVPQKPYCVADVRYANGADNAFVKQLLPQIKQENFYGYAGWNTSANALGGLLAGLKFRFNAKNYNEDAFKKLQLIRFLDDWAYQANIRKLIEKPCDIKDLMKDYKEALIKILKYELKTNIAYSYPWNRKFEVEIDLC